MAQSFQFIPTDIIEAWAKGEYYVGDIPSISYTRLGTALYLRSWYTYANETDDPNKLAGVAKIDIRGSFLFLGGIRLCEGDHARRRLVFWRTEASHFVSDDEILWFHAVFNTDVARDVRERYLPGWWFDSDASSPSAEQFGLSGEDWNRLLDALRNDFDADADRLQRECPPDRIDHGMLRFRVGSNPTSGHRCEYYQFYSTDNATPDLIKGVSRFNRAFKL